MNWFRSFMYEVRKPRLVALERTHAIRILTCVCVLRWQRVAALHSLTVLDVCARKVPLSPVL